MSESGRLFLERQEEANECGYETAEEAFCAVRDKWTLEKHEHIKNLIAEATYLLSIDTPGAITHAKKIIKAANFLLEECDCKV